MDVSSAFKQAVDEATYSLLMTLTDMESTYRATRWLDRQDGEKRSDLDKKFDKLTDAARQRRMDLEALARSAMLIMDRA